ncbi:DUF421 domain-containing protein [Deinococcus cavernae]|uniref:DUF421 domain-containing protein n=1 Tax=Deinococcus cavernae TaxID=2320857 RepID=A0A418VGK4_9DEIO|nr:YetF domain-containing protein [Deinococcus cavernae]RJF75248.1 DUF421 domain-containing protein [Deinococcus cavernae]
MDTVTAALMELLTPEGGWRTELLARIVLSTLILFGYVVLLARTFGSRTFASFTSYDFLTNVAAGSLVASAILGKSIVEASLSLLVLVLLQSGVSAWSARSEAAQRLFDNEPVILVENGVLREAAMKNARVSPAILEQHLRSAGLTDVSEVKFAVLESGGKISVVKLDSA